MEIAHITRSDAARVQGKVRHGVISGELLVGDTASDGLDFRMAISWTGKGDDAFTTARHRHSFQQVRWAVTGAANFAPDQDIPEGDVGYFPRGAYYGPQRQDGEEVMLLQFGFGNEHIGGRDSQRRGEEALAKIAARGGKLEGDVIVDVDPETGKIRRRDVVTALYEEMTGGAYTIDPSGYGAPVVMHPRSFEYFDVAGGARMKRLGCFFDHPGLNADLRLSIVRLRENSSFALGADRAQVAWSRQAGLVVNGGAAQPELAAVYSPRGETVTLASNGDIEIHLVEFPRLD